MSEDITIRPEADEDRKSIWNLNRAAFESEAEADLVDALRDGDFVEVSLVAEMDGLIVGHILFSRISIKTNLEPWKPCRSHRWLFCRVTSGKTSGIRRRLVPSSS